MLAIVVNKKKCKSDQKKNPVYIVLQKREICYISLRFVIFLFLFRVVGLRAHIQNDGTIDISKLVSSSFLEFFLFLLYIFYV